MKIALIGYGKMGKLLHSLCLENGYEIVSIIDHESDKYHNKIDKKSLNGADVALEFTQPDGVVERIKLLAECGVNIIIGTSGWYDRLAEVEAIATENKVGIMYGANFSIGMNIFFQIVDYMSKLMASIDKYDLYAYEEHHNMKKDKPSGTANYVTTMIKENDQRVAADFSFEAIRAGKKPGTHLVGYDGDYDFIELKHLARDRRAFVSGAVMSAHWIKGKTGFYNFSNHFKEIFGINE